MLPSRLGDVPGVLDTLSEQPTRMARANVPLPRRLLERVSPEDLAVPDARTRADVALLEKLAATAPVLGSSWVGRGFGRELNASDDRRHFKSGEDGLPVLEGKHVGRSWFGRRRVCAGCRRPARELLDEARSSAGRASRIGMSPARRTA